MNLSSSKRYSKNYLISFPQSGCQYANICQIWKTRVKYFVKISISVSIEIDLFPCRNSKLIQTSFDQSPHPCKYFEYIWGRNYSSIDASFNASFPYTWNFVYIRSSSNSCHFLPSFQNVARRRFRFLRSLDSRRGSNIYGNSM